MLNRSTVYIIEGMQSRCAVAHGFTVRGCNTMAMLCQKRMLFRLEPHLICDSDGHPSAMDYNERDRITPAMLDEQSAFENI